MREEKNTLD